MPVLLGCDVCLVQVAHSRIQDMTVGELKRKTCDRCGEGRQEEEVAKAPALVGYGHLGSNTPAWHCGISACGRLGVHCQYHDCCHRTTTPYLKNIDQFKCERGSSQVRPRHMILGVNTTTSLMLYMPCALVNKGDIPVDNRLRCKRCHINTWCTLQ